jgi:hypothetical protein
MTEAEWLASDDPEKMLLAIRDRASDRKMRLFGLACYQQIAHWATDERSRAAVAFADQFVEVGLGRRRGVAAVRVAAEAVCRQADTDVSQCVDVAQSREKLRYANAVHAAVATLEADAWFSAHLTSGFASNAIGWDAAMKVQRDEPQPPEYEEAQFAEKARQANLLRDIFASLPFRAVVISPSWLRANDGAVIQLARTIYDERAFDRLPVLADALEDAGCDDADLLAHCRGPAPHVRGCWVLDLLLRRS